jgi:hypothetical protein
MSSSATFSVDVLGVATLTTSGAGVKHKNCDFNWSHSLQSNRGAIILRNVTRFGRAAVTRLTRRNRIRTRPSRQKSHTRQTMATSTDQEFATGE